MKSVHVFEHYHLKSCVQILHYRKKPQHCHLQMLSTFVPCEHASDHYIVLIWGQVLKHNKL